MLLCGRQKVWFSWEGRGRNFGTAFVISGCKLHKQVLLLQKNKKIYAKINRFSRAALFCQNLFPTLLKPPPHTNKAVNEQLNLNSH